MTIDSKIHIEAKYISIPHVALVAHGLKTCDPSRYSPKSNYLSVCDYHIVARLHIYVAEHANVGVITECYVTSEKAYIPTKCIRVGEPPGGGTSPRHHSPIRIKLN